MQTDQFEELMANKSKDQKLMLYKWLKARQKVYEADPLSKFDHSASKPQQEFLSFTAPYQFFFGANKSGKTATMTYKAALIILGKHPTFHHKPEPGKPLYIWYCGQNREVLDGTPTRELLSWFRPDQYEIKFNSQGHVQRIVFTADNGGQTTVIYKPYEGGVDIFESENCHLAICDEEIPEPIWQALQARVFAYDGWIMNTLTRTKGRTWPTMMIEGQSYKNLMQEGYVQWVKSTLFDNKYFSQEQHKRLASGYDPDSAMYRIRVLGEGVSLEGLVYNIMEDLHDPLTGAKQSWHAFDDHELPDDFFETVKWYAKLDYGRRDPFTYTLIGLTPCGTHWFIDQTYKSGLELPQQGQAIQNMGVHWECKPQTIVADSQINSRQATGGTILQGYQKVLGNDYCQWRASPKDKKDPANSRARVAEFLMENPNTKKPFYRWHRTRCKESLREMANLVYAEGGLAERVSGDDHTEDPLRYWTQYGIQYDSFVVKEQYVDLLETVASIGNKPYYGEQKTGTDGHSLYGYELDPRTGLYMPRKTGIHRPGY
jgi:hypothetical protein